MSRERFTGSDRTPGTVPRDHLALAGLLAAGFAVRLLPLFWLKGVQHPDEFFQYLEPAYRHVTGLGVVTWEWREGIRSWLLPGFLSAVLAAAFALGASPGQAVLSVHLVLAALSLVVVAAAYRFGQRHFGTAGAIVVGSFAAFWPDLVYFSGRTLSEPVAADLLILGALLATDREEETPGQERRRSFLCGTLLTLTFFVRFQLAPPLAVLAVACLAKHWRSRLPAFLLGCTLVAAAAGLLDLATLGQPFQSIWGNFYVNLIANKSAAFGVQPWYWLFANAVLLWIVAVPLLVVALPLGARLEPALAIAAAATWVSHSAIGHKEIRFVFPATPLLVVITGLGVAGAWAILARRWKVGASTATLGVLAGIPAFCLAVGLAPRQVRRYWLQGRDTAEAQQFVAAQPGVCGIGIVDIHWSMIGTYGQLRQSVPIVLLDRADGQGSAAPASDLDAVNLVISRPDSVVRSDYRREQCFGEVCVLRRPGGCRPNPAREINRALIERGE